MSALEYVREEYLEEFASFLNEYRLVASEEVAMQFLTELREGETI